MSVSTYADYLISQGETVLELAGVPWMKYNKALIPATAMPVYVKLSRDEAVKAIKATRALFLRYSSEPQTTETNWWNMVCRHYDIMAVSPNTRSKIHRGLKRLKIRRVSPQWLAKQGYDCHVQSYARYQHASPMSRQAFEKFIVSFNGLPIFDLWACSNSKALVGYIICLREDNGVFMHTIDLTPTGLHDYSAYAMIHHLLDYYVNDTGIPVTNGARSVAHETAMQEFLRKFGFKREYCQLHVVYRPDIDLIVRLLYPFRHWLKPIEKLNFIHKVAAVLFQEEIARHQQGVPA